LNLKNPGQVLNKGSAQPQKHRKCDGQSLVYNNFLEDQKVDLAGATQQNEQWLLTQRL